MLYEAPVNLLKEVYRAVDQIVVGVFLKGARVETSEWGTCATSAHIRQF